MKFQRRNWVVASVIEDSPGRFFVAAAAEAFLAYADSTPVIP
jgi:hypothetical protein